MRALIHFSQSLKAIEFKECETWKNKYNINFISLESTGCTPSSLMFKFEEGETGKKRVEELIQKAAIDGYIEVENAELLTYPEVKMIRGGIY